MEKKEKYTDFFKEAEKIIPAERIIKAKRKAQKKILNLHLKQLREQAGITQKDIKSFGQSNVSRIESRTDMRISTLTEYVNDLGMGLEIRAIAKKKITRSKREKKIAAKSILLLKS